MPPTTPGINFVVWLIVLVAVGFVMMVLFKLAVWWGARYPMSSDGDGSRPDRAGSDDGSSRLSMPVLWQQNQEKPNQNATIEDVIELTYSGPITREQALTILALMQRENGEYFLSANKIRDIVGGADATVKAEVAALRPSKPTPPPARSIARPPGGWPKSTA
jgi:hypothetical protein